MKFMTFIKIFSAASHYFNKLEEREIGAKMFLNFFNNNYKIGYFFSQNSIVSPIK